MRKLHAVVAAVLAVFTFSPPARAEKVGVVLESYVGERSAQADGSLREILAALADRGYDYGTEVVGRVFESRVSRPAIAAGLPTDFTAQAERGHRAFVSGQFEDAAQILVPLVDAAHANPGAFALDQSLRTPLAKALTALALSHGRMGDSAAQEQVFTELVRSFPEMTQTKGTLGADAFATFEQVRKSLAAAKPSKLTITATDESAVVFINEKIERVGAVSKPVVPGAYRVFVQSGKKLSRVHLVNVGAGQDASLEIDLAFDAAIHTGPAWTGLTFATAAEREKLENIYAADFARAIGAKGVAVVGIDSATGRSIVFGTLVNPRTGRDIRRASVALEPAPAPDRLRGIATFLVENRTTPGLDIQVGEPVAGDLATDESARRTGGSGPSSRDAGRGGGRWGGWKYLTGAIALGGIGVGSYLLYLDGSKQGDGVNEYETTGAGIGTLAGAALFVGITVYLFATDGPTKQPTRSAYIVPTGDGAAVGFTTRF